MYGGLVAVDVEKDRLTEDEVRKLFTRILRDYVSGAISVDDLSLLCEGVYGKLPPLSDMYSLLLGGAELEWYLRHNPSAAASELEDLLRAFAPDALI
jgi:hypothetical protein